MYTIGFPISDKNSEKRRALLPRDIKLLKNPSQLYFEKDYGVSVGISDKEYIDAGANITTKEEVLNKNVICDPKIGDANYLDKLHNQIVFGWVHAVQNKEITDKIINSQLSAYAWEDMFYEGEHVFYRNNEIAGEAAVLHAFQSFGLIPTNVKVGILGNGNVARGAIKTLNRLGADVKVFTRRTENLFRKELPEFDVIINAVLWDTTRKDHILSKDDLKSMKESSLIIDISCDKNGGIETSVPTTISSPTYIVDGITHYVVDNTPSIFYRTATEAISNSLWKYIDAVIEGIDNEILENSLIINKGKIIDNRINKFQNRI